MMHIDSFSGTILVVLYSWSFISTEIMVTNDGGPESITELPLVVEVRDQPCSQLYGKDHS